MLRWKKFVCKEVLPISMWIALIKHIVICIIVLIRNMK